MEDKYKSLSVPELAGDEAFIRWIVKGENQQLWNQWLYNNPDQQASIAEATTVVRSLSDKSLQQLSTTEKLDLWTRIHSSIHQQPKTATRRSLFRKPWTIAAVAAAIALMFLVNANLFNSHFNVANGERDKLILPESSSIEVNADSKITYSKSKFSKNREVHLDGEAFFEVEPGSTFTVITKQGTVTVLGTSFNVKSRNSLFEVSCYTGKVQVTTSDDSSVLLTAGEFAKQEKSQLVENKFELQESTPLWTKGKFYFNDQPLSEVIAELERQYDIKVNMHPDLNELRYTGLFEAGNLDTALYTISWPLRLEYKINDSTVTISK